jgi:hypothetical protein
MAESWNINSISLAQLNKHKQRSYVNTIICITAHPDIFMINLTAHKSDKNLPSAITAKKGNPSEM